jgi:hypothetical protein
VNFENAGKRLIDGDVIALDVVEGDETLPEPRR